MAAPVVRAAVAANEPLNEDAKKSGLGLKRGNSHFDLEYSAGLNPDAIRAGFVRKVYGILAVQLLFTAAIAAAFCFVEPVMHVGIMMLRSFGLQILIFVAMMVTICGLMYNKDQYPKNVTWLVAFTFVVAAGVVGPICAMYTAAGRGVLIATALGITAAIFFALSAWVWYSDTDFSFMGGFLFTALIANILVGFIGYIFAWPAMMMFYHIIGILIFSGFILYDTDQIVNKVQLEDCDMGTAICGAVELYLDIINLFLHILQLLGMTQD